MKYRLTRFVPGLKKARSVKKMEIKKKADMPKRLPTVTLENGTTYFIDFRLNQLRNVNNPHDFMDFRSEFDMRDYIEENRKRSNRNIKHEKKDTFNKIKDQLISDGWTEQEAGTVYFNGEFATNFYNKDETETIHLAHNTFPDDELLDILKGEYKTKKTTTLLAKQKSKECDKNE